MLYTAPLLALVAMAPLVAAAPADSIEPFSNDNRITPFRDIVQRQLSSSTCAPGESPCPDGSGCVPTGATCCINSAYYCNAGKQCTATGCCTGTCPGGSGDVATGGSGWAPTGGAGATAVGVPTPTGGGGFSSSYSSFDADSMLSANVAEYSSMATAAGLTVPAGWNTRVSSVLNEATGAGAQQQTGAGSRVSSSQASAQQTGNSGTGNVPVPHNSASRAVPAMGAIAFIAVGAAAF